MTAPGDSVLLLILFAVLLACSGYAAGRLHQRYQTSQDREDAYRDGYETGTRSVFSAAVRMLGPKRSVRASAAVAPKPEPAAPVTAALSFPAPAPPPPYAVTEPSAVGGVSYHRFPDPRPVGDAGPALSDRSALALGTPQPGKHTVPDELVQAATYKLSPDRVARAKVQDATQLPDESTTRLSVPKPRQS
ncbi:MAG: hypothetical protein ABW022_14365 [Actinoplanes sp.]